jgi:prevent-host-death family protein
MSEVIQHRRLRNDSSEILRRVQAGETFQITNHGEVVAILSPAAHGAPPLRVRGAVVKGGFSVLPRVRHVRPVRDELDHLRRER